MFELKVAKLNGLLSFAMLGRVGDTDYMRGTDNWRVWLVEVPGRGATETVVVLP